MGGLRPCGPQLETVIRRLEAVLVNSDSLESYINAEHISNQWLFFASVCLFFTFYPHLGTDEPTKTDEILKEFQMAFDPPPPRFLKIMFQFSENSSVLVGFVTNAVRAHRHYI